MIRVENEHTSPGPQSSPTTPVRNQVGNREYENFLTTLGDGRRHVQVRIYVSICCGAHSYFLKFMVRVHEARSLCSGKGADSTNLPDPLVRVSVVNKQGHSYLFSLFVL